MARIITTFVFLATAVIVFFNWTLPNFKHIESLRGQEKSFNGVLARSKDLQTIRDDLLSKYNSISPDDWGRLGKILHSKVDTMKLIVGIENTAEKHGITLKNIDFQNSAKKQKASFGEKEKEFNETALNISMTGPYESFVSFLEDLEKSLNLIDVNQINFKADKADSYEFNIKAVTYWKQQE